MNSANAVAGDTDSRSDSSSFIESSHHLNNHNGTPSNHNNDRMSSPNGNRAGHNHSEEVCIFFFYISDSDLFKISMFSFLILITELFKRTICFHIESLF